VNKTISDAMQTINQQIREQHLENVAGNDETLAGRLQHVVTVFAVIRPLLVILATRRVLPAASRSAVSVFVQSLDALSVLAVPVDTGDVADFKAGRDL
jgi:hypothetical protein